MARLDGAETATSIGMPARQAFWTSSKEARPLTASDVIVKGSETAIEHRADDLVHGVVAADVFR